MHCQSCGNQLTPGLSYCPRCGAGQGLVRNAGLAPQVSPDSLIWAVVVSTIVVLGLILGGMVVLKNNGLGDELVWTFVATCFLALVGVDAMFLRMLQGLRSETRQAIEGGTVREAAPREIGETRGRVLSGAGAASVTEQTTRAFEHVHRGQGIE